MQIKAKKSLGQNFLEDKNILNKIASVVDIENKNILEIGPGQGALTNILLDKAKNVITYEIDKDMVEILKQNISNPKLQLIYGDFLNANLSNIEQDSIIVANIPYYITTDILFKIFDNSNHFKQAVILMQKEVAERIVAKPSTNEYSKLTVSSNYFCNVKKMFDVSPNAFNPAPKVFSSVVLFEFKKDLEFNSREFLSFVKLCFNFKRKKLLNNLILKYEKNIILEIFRTLNFSENIRAQELTLESFKLLFNNLNNI
ncbi:16S rRNA (adenine(1518)-N(6)/adenine(1519)-N(6))-dimethyltransferase RsmA [Mycoplasma miroungirhinis]|uniref:Ribosomal RNA small subunit methyltransferase A n=1 Tax=Mycoplasma miroungirhinis TaxID=754516 RepID=A0A6M4JBL7_9MOLU|nr:16S rRNA (adenine(1518)-N(6)/adenine(1519)-N(6))-dimethyltransferase RsmA [Mycoplasma miroungirhinis]QJR44354.1 16S rRNA (adenine(1518)-N(6)/adenine(1519)-N(6))-dimethyltransferase RsmA [Mycoplasma miroungirhinis]